jgi:hypothetical protein
MIVQESGGGGRVAECARRRVDSVPGDSAPARRVRAQFLAACGAASLGRMDVAFVTVRVTVPVSVLSEKLKNRLLSASRH